MALQGPISVEFRKIFPSGVYAVGGAAVPAGRVAVRADRVRGPGRYAYVDTRSARRPPDKGFDGLSMAVADERLPGDRQRRR